MSDETVQRGELEEARAPGSAPLSLMLAGAGVGIAAAGFLMPDYATLLGVAGAVLAASAVTRSAIRRPAQPDNIDRAPARESAPIAPPPADLSLFEAAPIGICRVDEAGAICACNEAFAAMIERPIEQLCGTALASLVTSEDHGRLADVLSRPQPLPHAGQRALEVTLSGKQRRVLSLIIGARAPGAADRVLHLVDITAFKELENQMIQARKMQAVGQLAGGIAHDFNNLLTAMIGFCDLLLLRHRAGDQSFADIMQIKQNANRAASLVRQLLAFSRQQTLRPKVFDITDTLAELSHLLRRLIGQTVMLRMVHGRDLGLVRVDQGQFEQVIINLAVNARDAMPEGGTLTIRTQNVVVAKPVTFAHETMPAGDYVLIAVEDTGTGIPPEVMAHIFEPFFTTKPVGSGTGLGLSTVYGIIRQTGGFIEVESEVGTGATFKIYLPRYAGAAPVEERASDEGERAETASATTTGTGTILLVEDEDPVRLFTARALRNKGYRVLEARSGEAALELLKTLNEPLDLMITDVVMPVIDGPTLIRYVRELHPDLKIICISGHTDEELRRKIADDTDVMFLPKPFSLKQLALRVKEKLEGLPTAVD